MGKETKPDSKFFAFIFIIFAALLINNSAAFSQPVVPDIPDEITVTGAPATGAHIKNILSLYLERSGYSAKPLENIKFQPLNPGESRIISIPTFKEEILQDGHKTLTSYLPKKVIIKNVYAPVTDTKYLAFSNHPERLKKDGLLYESGLIKNKPVRLRYYHLAEKGYPERYLGIYIQNTSKKPVKVHMIESVGGPSKNYVFAGHMNNMKFFDRLENNLGWIEEIPPESIVKIRQVYLNQDEVVSATMNINIIEGGPSQVMVFTSAEKEAPITYPLQSDEKDVHVRGAYPLTKIFTQGVFSTAQKETYYTIADTSFSDVFKGKNIRGDYGVMYEYDLSLKNPDKKERTIGLFFQPRGGIATATFSINGKVVSVNLTKAYKIVKLARINIPARSSKELKIKTMPEDASNYPVRLILMTDPK